MWIKICGVRDLATAERIAAVAPDAIGLNFYAGSPRSVSREVAGRITGQLPAGISPVGVFVNHSATEIADTVAECGLAMLQLHGDESPELLADVQSRIPASPMIRAWRTGGDDWGDLADYLAECRKLNVRLAACLVDAKVAGTYGGTGATLPWKALATGYVRDRWPPLILAGGLNADNVRDAIDAVRPWGVDVASGVESSPGVKDFDRVARFVAAARTTPSSRHWST